MIVMVILKCCINLQKQKLAKSIKDFVKALDEAVEK